MLGHWWGQAMTGWDGNPDRACPGLFVSLGCNPPRMRSNGSPRVERSRWNLTKGGSWFRRIFLWPPGFQVPMDQRLLRLDIVHMPCVCFNQSSLPDTLICIYSFCMHVFFFSEHGLVLIGFLLISQGHPSSFPKDHQCIWVCHCSFQPLFGVHHPFWGGFNLSPVTSRHPLAGALVPAGLAGSGTWVRVFLPPAPGTPPPGKERRSARRKARLSSLGFSFCLVEGA